MKLRQLKKCINQGYLLGKYRTPKYYSQVFFASPINADDYHICKHIKVTEKDGKRVYERI